MSRFTRIFAALGFAAAVVAAAPVTAFADPGDGWKQDRDRRERGRAGEYRYEETYDPRTGRYKVERSGPGYHYEEKGGPRGYRVEEKRGGYRYEDKRRGYRYDDRRGRHGHRYAHREFHRGGPPPWAPAHGYRRKHRDAYYARHRDHYRYRRINDRYRSSEEYAVETTRVMTLPQLGNGSCNREVLGAIVGGATGALVGSRFGKGDGKTAMTIAGAIAGLLVGGSVGRSMDRVDQSCVGQVLERAPTGQTVEWRNPDAGAQYRVTPQETYQTEAGEYCREYQATIIIDGREQEGHGTACRQPDGSWKKTG